MSVGSVFVEIIPRVMGMSAAMTRDVVAPAEQGGTEAGRTFSTAFTRSVTSGTSATTAAVQSQVRAAQAAVEQSSVAISAARDKELAAADRVTIAETKLAETRARNAAGSSQVVAAEARLEAAKRGEVTASERLVVAESNEGRAKTELIARNDALATSNARAEESSAAGSSKALGLVGSLSKLAVGTTAVSAILGGDALHQAGNYQQSLTKLATTAGESTSNLKLVGDGMLNMAGQVGVSAQDLSKAMYVVESSGFHGADSLVVLKAAAQGAKQENADLGHVTDAVTTALHDYNLPASDAAKVTSQLVTAVSHGKTTFDDLTGAMHSVTPIAAAAGISLADVSGTLAAMTASGVSADQAGQNLGSTIKGLSAPTQPVIKEMAALGLNSVELSKNLGPKGVSGTLQEVSEAILQKMGPAGTTLLSTLNQSKLAGTDANKMYQAMAPEVRKVADELMNGTITSRQFTTGTGHLDAAMQGQAKSWLTQYKNATGFSAALKTGGNDTQTYMEALKRATGTTDGMAVALQVTGEHAGSANAGIKDVANATAQADGNIKGWSEVQGNFNQQLSEVVAGLKSWVIELGQKLLPKATEFLGWLKDAAHWIGDHKTLVKDTALAVGTLAAAYVTYKAAAGFSDVIKALSAAQWGLNAAMKANSFGLIVVAITALVAGAIYAYTHFATFRNIVNDVGSAVSAVVGFFQRNHDVAIALGAVLAAALLPPMVGLAASLVVQGVGWTATAIGVTAYSVASKVAAAGQWLLNVAMEANPIGLVVIAITALAGGLILAYNHSATFRAIVTAAFIEIKRVVSDVVDWFKGPFVNFFKAAFNDVKNAVSAVVDWFINLPNLISQNWDHLVGFFRDLWGKVTSAVSTGIDNTVSFVERLPQRIAYGLGHLAGTMVRAAIDGWAGFTHGIETAWNDTYAFVAGLPARIVIALVGLGFELRNTAVSAWNAFTSGISTAWDATYAFVAGLPARIVIALVGLGFQLRDVAVSSWQSFTSGTSTGWNDTYAFVKSLPGRILTALAGLGISLLETAVTAWSEFTRGITEAWGTTVIFLLSIPSRIRGYFATAEIWLVDTGVAILQGLIGGLESGAMSVIHWFTGLVANFLGGFKDALGVHSPSTVFASIGNDILQGLINGLQALGGAVLSVITGVGQLIIDGFRASITFLATMWSDLWTGIRDVAMQIWSAIRDFLTNEMHGWSNIFNTIWQGISDVFTTIWNTLHDTAVNVWTTVHDFFTNAFHAYTVFFSTVWQDILDFFTTRWNNLHDNAVNIWNTISDFFTNAFHAYTAFFSGVWQNIEDFFITRWHNLQNNATIIWNAISDFFSTAFRTFTDFFSGVWQGILDYFTRTWDNIRQKASDAWANIRGFFEGAFSGFKQYFIDTWNSIVTDFSNIWNGIVGIADKIWVKVQDKFKSGVNDVIKVINDFAGAINTVASAIGFDLKLHVNPLAEGGPVVGRYEGGSIVYKEVIHRAAGGGVSGQLPGYSPGVDTIPAMAGRQPYMLAGGEYIVRPESTRAIGPAGMAAINNAYRTPIGLAEGGATWPAMLGIVQRQFPWAVDTSDYRPGDTGYHGKSQALDVGAPGDDPGRLAEVAAWVGSNYSNSTELIHNPNGSIKYGKAVPPSFWGAETWAQHANHVHWANDRDPSLNSGNLLGTIGSNISGAVSSLLGAAARLAIKPAEAAISAIGDKTGYPGGYAAHSINTVLEKLVSFSDAKDAASGGGGASLGPLGGNADAYAREITRSAMEHGFGKPGAAIGVATSIVETGLKEYANSGIPASLAFPHDAVGSDHDSVGLFQQRQAGWGTLEQRMNPHASADLFFNKLGAFDWRSMDPGAAAQRVQVSAFPDRYSQEMGRANAMVAGYDDGGWMKPGAVGANFSTKPEPVFSSAQWEVLRANLNTGHGGGTKVVAGTHVEAGATIVIGDTEKHDREQRQAVNLLVAQARL